MKPSSIVFLFLFSILNGCNDQPELIHEGDYQQIMAMFTVSSSSPIDETVVPVSTQPKSTMVVFKETTMKDLEALEILADVSEEEACRSRDFLAVPVELPHRPLGCGEYDGTLYRIRILNCGKGKLTLTGIDFDVEIPRLFRDEDAEKNLFSGKSSASSRLRNVRLCNFGDLADSEWCRSTTLERISEKKGVVHFSLVDEESVVLDSKKEQIFDFKATRSCNKSVMSLLRLNLSVTRVFGSIHSGESAFGAVLNPRRAMAISYSP